MSSALDHNLAHAISKTSTLLEEAGVHDLELTVKNKCCATVHGMLEKTSVTVHVELTDMVEMSLWFVADNTNTHTSLAEVLNKLRQSATLLLDQLNGQHQGLSVAAELEYHLQQAKYLAGHSELKDPDECLEDQLLNCHIQAQELCGFLEKPKELEDPGPEGEKEDPWDFHALLEDLRDEDKKRLLGLLLTRVPVCIFDKASSSLSDLDPESICENGDAIQISPEKDGEDKEVISLQGPYARAMGTSPSLDLVDRSKPEGQ